MRTVRPPAVAGMFYPGDAGTLARDVDAFLDAASAPATTPEPLLADPAPPTGRPRGIPKALVVPHAGYVYSGAVAGRGFAAMAPVADRIRHVVLLGPVHRVPVRGLALPGADALATPLGEVPVESDAAEGLPGVVVRPDVHALEHSLEVQVPFLQRLFPDAAITPLAVGDATPEQVADVLEALWGGADTLIVVSTDLSHYLHYDDARALDGATIEDVLNLDGPVHHRQACGASPLNGLLVAARRRGLRPVLIAACNSGDTAGDKDRVVGYASFGFHEPGPDAAAA